MADTGPDTAETLLTSSKFREIFRCQRERRVRVYGLYLLPKGAELWRITQAAGEPSIAVKEADLSSVDEAAELFHEIGLCLKAAGWREA